MDISEVRIKLVDRANDRLKAFCTLTFDNEFVVRDVKIIEGPDGFFVAMPSRKLTDHCPKCGSKNHLRANFCNDCGARLASDRSATDQQGRSKLHADMAHPINPSCREKIQKAVIAEYQHEVEAAKQPGYKPKALDYEDDDYDGLVRSMARNSQDRGESSHPAAGRARTPLYRQPNPKPGDAPSFGAELA